VRVSVDRSKCDGLAACVEASPEVFDLGDDDLAIVLVERPSEQLRERVERAARVCPKAAITISE
jgi:ferredoxin